MPTEDVLHFLDPLPCPLHGLHIGGGFRYFIAAIHVPAYVA